MTNSKKHAYMLMLHHRKDLAELLLEELDDERNDLYIHIDPSSKDLCFEDFHFKHCKAYKVEPTRINWGGYSQIECELKIIETAHKNGPYAYYHFVQNSSFPLKSQDELHSFYEKHKGDEFISFDDYSVFSRRVEQYNLFNECYKGRIIPLLNSALVRLQKILGINRLKKYNLKYAKGSAMVSITDDFVKYILRKKELIHDLFKYSFCGDEIFIHTLAYNSSFKEKIHNPEYKNASNMWVFTWLLESDYNLDRKGHNFIYEDLDYILSHDANFARKFEGSDGLKLIEEIKRIIHEK